MTTTSPGESGVANGMGEGEDIVQRQASCTYEQGPDVNGLNGQTDCQCYLPGYKGWDQVNDGTRRGMVKDGIDKTGYIVWQHRSNSRTFDLLNDSSMSSGVVTLPSSWLASESSR